MKLNVLHSSRPRDSQRGSVVLVLLAFLVLMLMLYTATWNAVSWSRKEVALIEKHQVERLATMTNAPPAAARSMSTR